MLIAGRELTRLSERELVHARRAIGMVFQQPQLLASRTISPYVNLIVAREDNRDRPALQSFVKAYQSDEVDATAQRLFHGGAVKRW